MEGKIGPIRREIGKGIGNIGPIFFFILIPIMYVGPNNICVSGLGFHSFNQVRGLVFLLVGQNTEQLIVNKITQSSLKWEPIVHMYWNLNNASCMFLGLASELKRGLKMKAANSWAELLSPNE